MPTNNRSQLLRTENNILITDAYNANPTSMEAALDNFRKIQAGHKTVMLGNMLELGEDSAAEHRKILSRTAASADIEKAFFVGEEFWKAASESDERIPAMPSAPEELSVCSSVVLKDGNGHETGFFLTSKDLAGYLKEHPVKGNTVLIKGSRGTRMETVLEYL